MNTDAVIGCDAVDAGPEWLRLRTASGAVRTITWDAVKIAGMGGNHEGNMTISGVTEKATPYFPTHDSLWMVSAEGQFAQIMLEKTNPQRDVILTTFAQQLGPRWHGDQLSSDELTNELFAMPKMGSLIPKPMLIMLGIMILVFVVAIAVAIFSHSKQ